MRVRTFLVPAAAAAVSAVLVGGLRTDAQTPACVSASSVRDFVAITYDETPTCDFNGSVQQLDVELPYGITVAEGIEMAEHMGGHIRLVAVDVDT